VSGITVGIDGSPHSAHALDWAVREAAIRHAPLTVLIVDSVPASPWTGHPIVMMEPDRLDGARQAAAEMTAKAISQLGAGRPPSVHVRAVTGFPVRELISASQEADLVVVGSRGAGGFARLLLGSVSSQVVQHAHGPVVVVPSSHVPA
jgi:nucleotide-binding universal stress UspA family protein